MFDYHLFCESCEKHFPLYRPDVNWEDVWLYGFTVRCTECGHEQDKRDAAEKGKWLVMGDSEAKFIGAGCAVSQASASLFTGFLKGKHIYALSKITKENVLELIKIDLSKNPSRMRCALLPFEAMKKATQNEKKI